MQLTKQQKIDRIYREMVARGGDFIHYNQKRIKEILGKYDTRQNKFTKNDINKLFNYEEGSRDEFAAGQISGAEIILSFLGLLEE